MSMKPRRKRGAEPVRRPTTYDEYEALLAKRPRTASLRLVKQIKP